MASREEDEELGTDAKIRRQVGRTIANWLMVFASLAVLVGWGAMGVYQLEPGEAAVILRVGAYDRTVSEPGLKWHWPPPLEYAATVNIAEIRRLEFGAPTVEPDAEGSRAVPGQAIQTVDSNIVNLSFVLQYEVDDAFSFVYGMAQPRETLHDATQAAVREVIGHEDVDAVLSVGRAQIQTRAQEILQRTLAEYFGGADHESPFLIRQIKLQDVQPPDQVQGAFDDVVAAQQDEVRVVSIARGDAQEIRERANAEAIELRQAAMAYKEAKVLESRGESRRFESLLAEYRRAPDVTRRRLYLETMEDVLPGIEKVIVEPDTVNMMPFLPLAQQRPLRQNVPSQRSQPEVPAAAEDEQ